MRANSWMIHQVLAAGVHGILMCNANDPEAIRAFVEATRYPFAPNAAGLDAKEGMTRGNGSQGMSRRSGACPPATTCARPIRGRSTPTESCSSD